MMDVTAALRAFVRTVERGSITAAARDLGVSQPAISKHLGNLERHVGARLLERSSRLVRPTSQGLDLYEAGRTALATIDSAVEGVRNDMGAVEGLLRVHAPSCVGAKHLHPLAMAFQRRHPGVTIDLMLENREIDLVYENLDLAVIYGRPPSQDVVIRRLGLVRRILVAAPALIARTGPIDTVERLSEVPFASSVRQPLRDRVTLQNAAGDAVDVPIRPLLRTNSADAMAATLLEGHAAGPVQQLLVNDALAAGTLVRILPEFVVRPTEAFLAYPSVRFMRPVVRAFADFAFAGLRAVDGVDA